MNDLLILAVIVFAIIASITYKNEQDMRRETRVFIAACLKDGHSVEDCVRIFGE